MEYLLDFNFRVSSYRNMSESLILKDFTKAWLEDKELALKYLFYVRDIREGLGERKLFRDCLPILLNSNIEDKDTIFSVILDGALYHSFIFDA